MNLYVEIHKPLCSSVFTTYLLAHGIFRGGPNWDADSEVDRAGRSSNFLFEDLASISR